MLLEQTCWSVASGWQPVTSGRLATQAQLALAFGSRAALETPGVLDAVRRAYPTAYIAGCSTAGEIAGTHVFDDSVVVTAIAFRNTPLTCASVEVTASSLSEEAGAQLAERLANDDLRHVLVFSDGLHVNGSRFIRGLTERLPGHVTVTGGLAADGARFEETKVLVNGTPRTDVIVGIGLRGESIRVGYGSVGGWDPFGPERIVTRARGNVLYELDGRSALGLYRRYLGEQARDLPAAGLLFPLSLRKNRESRGVVRTILSVCDAEDSLTFAGDIAEGSYAQLMRANFDRLIEGAAGAARISAGAICGRSTELALLISCVGRKMVLKQRVEEEVEGVRDVVGPGAILAGFYSYGEISPFTSSATCELHNQTMTVTTLSEA